MNTPEHIGQVIKRIRNEKGLTQEALARQAGITYTSLVKIENMQVHNPRVKTVHAISEVLKVPMETLLGKTSLK